jgi:5'-deoxynucleotidase YfbR-like HD superfamily hydrolase
MATSPRNANISDLKTGKEIIGRLPLSDPSAAIRDLVRILDGLFAAPPEHQTFFQLLELMLPPIIGVAEELSKRYVNKPVPLDDAEDAVFREVVQLWQKTAKAYARCAEKTPPENGAAHADQLATLLHRCIYFTGMAILEHHRARREAQWGLWLDLHGHYGTAEDLGVAIRDIPDVFEAHVGKTHCAATYLAFVLCDMAGGYGLSLRDQRLVYRWATAWSRLIRLYPAVVGGTLPLFAIDLMQDVALRPSSECLRIDQVRCLDTSHLAAHISEVRQKLRQRVPPNEIGLGENCTRQQCTRLLGHLARQWSQGRAARKFRRHATSGVIQICAGFEEMHYFISGKKFQQPGSASIYSRDAFERVFSLRFQENPQQTQQYQQEEATTAYAADTWEMVNQSANGFRLIRNVEGRKIAHGQLLALCPRDSERFLLAQATWLMQENHGGLISGLKALPGLPQAICARPVPAMGQPLEMYHRAFLLPALETTGAEASLVLPAGWFRPRLIVEVFADEAWRASLKEVLDSGPDFDRVSFEVC